MFRRILLLGAALAACAADLHVATATVDITAPEGYPMGGYGARKDVSKGTHDPLPAKVLLIKSGGREFAIVTYDLVFIASTRVAQQARESLGISPVLQIASHTHSGPVSRNRGDPENDPWYRGMEDKVVAAMKQARSHYQPAQFSVAQASIYIGHNRRKVNEDGSVTMFWRNADRLPTHPVDPRIGLWRFTGADGRVLALLVNYACHAVGLGPENLEYSADYPGEMMRVVENAYPGAICLFIQGGAGNINPYYDKTALIDDAVELMRRTGRTLAREVLSTAANIKPHNVADTELRIAREPLEFKARWNHDKVLAGVDPKQLSLSARLHLEAATRGPYIAPVTTMLLGREFAYVGLPCEIFVDFQTDLRERVRAFPVIFAGYTNKNLGYVPTIRAAVDGGYSASQIGSYLEVGAGARMIDAAIIRLGYWTGALQTKAQTPQQ